MKNTLRILHTADLHIGYNGGIAVEKYLDEAGEKIPIRVLDVFDRLERMIKFAIDKKVDIFIIAGDVFERPSIKNLYQHMFAKRIGDLVRHKIHVVVATGNHDTDGTTSALSAVSELTKTQEYLHVVEKKQIIKTKKADVLVIPYYVGIENRIDKDIKLALEKRNFDKVLIGVSHLAVNGAKIGNHKMELKTKVEAESLRGFLYFALGDLHINQKIGEGTRIGKGSEIWYSGSATRHDMGEKEEKFFNYVYFEDYTTLNLPKVKQVPLPDRKMVSAILKYKEAMLVIQSYKRGNLIIDGQKVDEGDLVKIGIRVTKDHAKKSSLLLKLDKIMKKEKVINADIFWEYINTHKTKRIKTKGKNIEAATKSYIDEHPPKNVSAKKTKKTVAEILEEVRKKRNA